ncbi:hypothetical protein CO180_03040 [candidate division WWE3 bacterium CG_4_9_14_3_um_filter_41_6]|uniref:Thioredoxin domain-containing protein n=1 Tax=candidate division WWE3 bacterium CG_4_10_14_0_2_um_filter_41_14 TaxID=1975072 RepID=A0A2M7TH53_UNCKA|nr:MAG: hypothetical protein COY32_05200 [candidate division WWE3 bacterium CG_4_10_14_0_2_um_filter_41_14]PJA38655.1 MAG: hypothetical protein CO180_03040 [candidate division WWE3 bacterium CG_4_9_14_3_um_filter_41_6]
MNQKLGVIIISFAVIVGLMFAVNLRQREDGIVSEPSPTLSVSDVEIADGQGLPEQEFRSSTAADTTVDDSTKTGGSESAQILNEFRYLSYTPELFESHADTKRVYFFHAPSCTTCQDADREFTLEQENIPGDVTLFRTDYDHETGLREDFAVTNQHTLVYVDSNGNVVSTWSGGGMQELIEHTQAL